MCTGHGGFQHCHLHTDVSTVMGPHRLIPSTSSLSSCYSSISTPLHLTLTSASSKYYEFTDIRLQGAGRDYDSPYFSQATTVVLNKLGNGVLSILRAIILTVKPLELFSSKVDLAYAALRVSFRMSNGGGLMYMMYGFNCGIRSIFKAYKQKGQNTVSMQTVQGTTQEKC